MKEITVTFIQQSDNSREDVKVPVGNTLMEAARYYSENNYVQGIEADCGGTCACGTCHVIVDDVWFDKLDKPKKSSPELDLLDYDLNSTDKSRLSCQILLTEKLDGLIVYVP